MIKMTDTSAEPRSDFRESLWNTTAPFKMGVGKHPPPDSDLLDRGYPASRGAPLSLHPEVQL